MLRWKGVSGRKRGAKAVSWWQRNPETCFRLQSVFVFLSHRSTFLPVSQVFGNNYWIKNLLWLIHHLSMPSTVCDSRQMFNTHWNMTICNNLWVLALCKDNKARMVEMGGGSAFYCKRITFSSVPPLVNTTNSFQFLVSSHLPQGFPKPLFKRVPSPLPFLLSTEFIGITHLITLLFF